MEVEIYPPMLPTRPCRFCLSFALGCVFADFDVDEAGHVYARRISFDGFGCYGMPPDVPRMDIEPSRALLAMVDAGTLDQEATMRLLRPYFEVLADFGPDEALREHHLL